MAKIFRGRFECKVDEKGRCSWPSTYRSLLNSKSRQMVVTNSQSQGQPILDVYTLPQWEKLESQISKMPSLKKEVQAYRRFYLSGGQTLTLDGHGRFLIPSSLRAYAQIGEELVLVGMGDKVEIWPAEVWVQVQGQMAKDFEETLRALAELEGGLS